MLASALFSEATTEEEKLTAKAGHTDNPAGLIVLGDGSWRKRGFTSLQGVFTLIGHYSRKVLDLIVKSLYCKKCEYWKGNLSKEEFKVWKESHKEENYTK